MVQISAVSYFRLVHVYINHPLLGNADNCIKAGYDCAKKDTLLLQYQPLILTWSNATSPIPINIALALVL